MAVSWVDIRYTSTLQWFVFRTICTVHRSDPDFLLLAVMIQLIAYYYTWKMFLFVFFGFFILLNSIFSTFYSRPQTNGSAATILESTVCKRILKKTQKRLLAKVTKFALCIICEVSFLGTESAQYSLRVSSKAGHRWRNRCWPVAQDCQGCCHVAVS